MAVRRHHFVILTTSLINLRNFLNNRTTYITQLRYYSPLTSSMSNTTRYGPKASDNDIPLQETMPPPALRRFMINLSKFRKSEHANKTKTTPISNAATK